MSRKVLRDVSGDLSDVPRRAGASAPLAAASTAAGSDAAVDSLDPAWALDPLAFVQGAFPWGQGALAGCDGPDEWQAAILALVRDGLAEVDRALQIAVASGHGIGKSALVAWLILWAMATCEDAKGVVTANTETQLRTKTWAELAKWHRLSAIRRRFTLTATALAAADPERAKTWRVDLVPWSERNTEAFAGLHNAGKRSLVVFDEASAIPDVIWETTEGALTDAHTQILWCAFGNPTRNTGRFRECFGRFKHRWRTRQIDSRAVRITNKEQIRAWVEDYGEDSDFVRVRVRGVFPRAGSCQFIAAELADRAALRDPEHLPSDPLVIGVDVARFGDDQSVIRCRRGRDARSIPAQRFRGIDTMQLAGLVAQAIAERHPAAVFVDEGGVGGGVVDRLRQLGHRVIGVNFGARADGLVDGLRCANKRAEMWARLRDWLKTGGAIDAGPELAGDLSGVEYGFTADNAIQLERKEDMKKRGLASPDDADALALTFAFPVAPLRWGGAAAGTEGKAETDYDPFG